MVAIFIYNEPKIDVRIASESLSNGVEQFIACWAQNFHIKFENCHRGTRANEDQCLIIQFYCKKGCLYCLLKFFWSRKRTSFKNISEEPRIAWYRSFYSCWVLEYIFIRAKTPAMFISLNSLLVLSRRQRHQVNEWVGCYAAVSIYPSLVAINHTALSTGKHDCIARIESHSLVRNFSSFKTHSHQALAQ